MHMVNTHVWRTFYTLQGKPSTVEKVFYCRESLLQERYLTFTLWSETKRWNITSVVAALIDRSLLLFSASLCVFRNHRLMYRSHFLSDSECESDVICQQVHMPQVLAVCLGFLIRGYRKFDLSKVSLLYSLLLRVTFTHSDYKCEIFFFAVYHQPVRRLHRIC